MEDKSEKARVKREKDFKEYQERKLKSKLNPKLKQLQKEQNKLYTELTDTFTDKEQFILLNKLIDSEIELEKYCNG